MPSPIDHTVCDTFAVAVTVTPPAVADAERGPNVVGDGSDHIHIGIPTTYFPAARGLATAGPVSFIEAAARRATASGSMTGAAAGAWPSGSHTVRAPCEFGQLTP
ncbi:hypothetical protein [Streptomyces sp. CA-256286]|uniref:hypothetical protein n=1 Tax=Streptomyces sp. CA-256286 TaxID=2801033 RepID=UPI001F612004|nr:hypothetical protein [Streptomyces sp. CA-256286]